MRENFEKLKNITSKDYVAPYSDTMGASAARDHHAYLVLNYANDHAREPLIELLRDVTAKRIEVEHSCFTSPAHWLREVEKMIEAKLAEYDTVKLMNQHISSETMEIRDRHGVTVDTTEGPA